MPSLRLMWSNSSGNVRDPDMVRLWDNPGIGARPDTAQYGTREPRGRPNAYVWLLTRAPYAVTILCLVMAGLSSLVFVYHDTPDFKNPTEGFEARGSNISAKRFAFRHVIHETKYGNFTQKPVELMSMLQAVRHKRDVVIVASPPSPNLPQTSPMPQTAPGVPPTTSSVPPSYPVVPTTSSIPPESQNNKSPHPPPTTAAPVPTKHHSTTSSIPSSSHDNNSLYSPRESYTLPDIQSSSGDGYEPAICTDIWTRSIYEPLKNFKIIFAPKHGSLFTAQSMRDICTIEDNYVTSYINTSGIYVCRMYSVPLYVSLMVGKHGRCHDITEEDMHRAKAILQMCYPHYVNQTLQEGCSRSGTYVPPECCYYNAPYKLLYYLLDAKFDPNTDPIPQLSFAMFMFNIPVNDTEEYYLKMFGDKHVEEGNVQIVGMYQDLNTKFNIFQHYLVYDFRYFGVAALFICVIIMTYLFDVVLMIATLINVLASALIAYFTYTMILRMDFFPFINSLGILILIAIGADDVFIFYDTWRQYYELDKQAPVSELLTKTFRHAALSIFVTSLTTSSAFFANYVNEITAIRCFGVFAGVAVLANFAFMVTWTPSVIVLLHWLTTSLRRTSFHDDCRPFCDLLSRFQGLAGRLADHVFGKMIPLVLTKVWWLSMFILTALSLAGFLVVFWKPGLKLPTSLDFQLFRDSQPLEYFDLHLRDKFAFLVDESKAKEEEIDIRFMWGARAVDNGNPLNPHDNGSLVLDPNFNFTAPDSQEWFSAFCEDVKKQSFIDENFRGAACFLDQFKLTLQHTCPIAKSGAGLPALVTECCSVKVNYTADYLPSWFIDKCIALNYISLGFKDWQEPAPIVFPLYRTDANNHSQIVAILVTLPTVYHLSASYESMAKYYETINKFMDSWMHSAPPGMRSGFVTGVDYFRFYDLQRAISVGTFYSIALSLSVAFVVMLITTLNVLLTIYALCTISLAIGSTVGCLVLLGWTLNIVESVTISLAVGLSIDFTIHYGVAYRLSNRNHRLERMRESLSAVGSAVAMAALTTFMAGAAVMPSHVLAYLRLGTFLMLVMTFSWIYATFFFLAVCRIIGPNGNFCQIPVPCGNGSSHEEQEQDFSPGMDDAPISRPCSSSCCETCCSCLPCCRRRTFITHYNLLDEEDLLLDDELYPTCEDYINSQEEDDDELIDPSNVDYNSDSMLET